MVPGLGLFAPATIQWVHPPWQIGDIPGQYAHGDAHAISPLIMDPGKNAPLPTPLFFLLWVGVRGEPSLNSMADSANSSALNLGVVKWYNGRKGYGFLTDTTSKQDYFVHVTQLQTTADVFKKLFTGEYVQFKPFGDEMRALEITGVNGGPLMCETRASQVSHSQDKPPQVKEEGAAQEMVVDAS